MGRTSQAPTAENARIHAEITAIFLRHEVGRRFRSSEKRMQRLVDAAGLADTGKVFRPSVVVTCFQLLQGDFVWRVTVNLVGAHQNKNGFRAMLATGFKN